MSTIEARLHDALAAAGQRALSPDLFARVVGSIADDRAARRRRARAVVLGAAVVIAAAAAVWVFTPRQNGRLLMPWWVMEILTNVILIAIALWLGPFIKRFGRAYAADVFHDNPQTGKSYIVLTDIVYYLIFTAYILFTVQFSPPEGYINSIELRHLGLHTARIGGILLIIGLLHGLNIIVMPILGRLFSLNRKLSGRD